MNMAEAIKIVKHPVRECRIRRAWKRYTTALHAWHEHDDQHQRNIADQQYDAWIHGHDELDS